MKKNKRFDLDKVLNRRYKILFLIIIFFFLLLLTNFFRVMIVENEKYEKLLDELTYDVVLGESTPRGRILNETILILNILQANK